MEIELHDKEISNNVDVVIEYLQFLNFKGDAKPTLGTLKQLHQLHPQKITLRV